MLEDEENFQFIVAVLNAPDVVDEEGVEFQDGDVKAAA